MPKKSNLPVEVLLPGGQIEAYVQAVSQIPILTAEEEKKLASIALNRMLSILK